MILRNVIILTGVLALLLVSACGASSDQQSTPQAEPTGTVSNPTSPPVTKPAATPSQNGGSVKLEVVDFQVWQDFMPGLREGGPPLHAAVTLRADGPTDARVGTTTGTITISRPGGEMVVKSPITIVEAVPVPESGAEGKMDLQLAMTASPISIQLTENEPLVGKLELTLGLSNVVLDLPSTPLMFTH